MRHLVLFFILLGFFSCKKDTAAENVELFLLKSSSNIAGKCQVDASTAVLQDAPLLYNNDFLKYSASSNVFTISVTAYQKITALADKTPFAITVNRQVIYYGYYKPWISSSSCDHSITMNGIDTPEKKLSMMLGYPSLLPGTTIDDQRNNPALLNALQKQGKLQ